MPFKSLKAPIALEWIQITAGTLALAIGNHFFKFPNKFVFGGVTGLAVLIADVTPFSTSSINLVLNLALLLLGLFLLGKKFSYKTIYATALLTLSISALGKIYPMPSPFTDQQMLEFSIAILLTAFGSAILFHNEASSGGTDIIAMILKKRTGSDIGQMLVMADIVIVIIAFFIFDIRIALFSSLGLLVKSMLIDTSVASLNRSRMVTVICDDPSAINDFIIHDLHKGATFYKAEGAFTHQQKNIIIAVLKPKQEIRLRRFIRDHVAAAFVLVSDSSLIFGKGFSDIT